MGYYTYFTLSYYASPEDTQALNDFEPDENEFNLDSDLIKQLIKDNGDNDWKWYDWEKDMEALARKFPNITFVLHGDGEESDDIWEWRGKGDKYEYHRMEMPPFTEILIP
jgi:hypothetical protein